MRTTIIPAQITTVEDKIAGSLSLKQVLLLMMPVVITAALYATGYPQMKLSVYKIVLIVFFSLIFITLSIRIKDNIILDWLFILIRYLKRPRFWLYDKNDLTNRTVDIPLPMETKASDTPKIFSKTQEAINISIADLVKFEQLVYSGKVAVRYQFEQK